VIAVDTNILVRFLTNDDKKQAELARKAMRDNEIWLSKTVLLETEWVLRYSYDFDPRQILGGFRALLDFPTCEWKTPLKLPQRSMATPPVWTSLTLSMWPVLNPGRFIPSTRNSSRSPPLLQSFDTPEPRGTHAG
jgi:hypothetical protein